MGLADVGGCELFTLCGQIANLGNRVKGKQAKGSAPGPR